MFSSAAFETRECYLLRVEAKQECRRGVREPGGNGGEQPASQFGINEVDTHLSVNEGERREKGAAVW